MQEMTRGIAAAFALALAGLLALSATVQGAFAQDDYRIRPGDLLRIEVLEDPGLNRTALVSPDGRISFPLAGGVTAAGRTLEQVQSDLASRIAANFATTPNVFIAVERVTEPRAIGGGGTRALALIEVYVLGEAARPGKLDIKAGSTVLQAFAQMGGFTKFAATKRVQLRRNGTTYSLNYDAIERGASTAGSTVLQAGDVILVPQRRLFE
jgi:polysaccharide export outer membrane protein